METPPHVEPEILVGKALKAQEVMTLVLGFKKCPSFPSHSLSGLLAAFGMSL